MNLILGFGSTEEAFEEQERKFFQDLARDNRTKDNDHNWYTFSDENISAIQEATEKRSAEYRKMGEEYKEATEYPSRYSYYHVHFLHDLHNIVVIMDFWHINRRHAFSPDGWALMKRKRAYHVDSND